MTITETLVNPMMGWHLKFVLGRERIEAIWHATGVEKKTLWEWTREM